MSRRPTVPIPKHVVHGAAKIAREYSSEATRERVLVSQSVARVFRDYLQENHNLASEDGRATALRYAELLDVCDFSVNNWRIEVRAVTNADRNALYVPTVPLMVGFLSDFYVCAAIDASLSNAELLGFASRAELNEAELSGNGLFAIVPTELLRPLDSLVDEIRVKRGVDTDQMRLYEEWRTRAELITRQVTEILAAESAFGAQHVERLARGLRDDVLRVYGENLPEIGFEALFGELFRRFGIEDPVPSSPDNAVAFESPVEDRTRFKDPKMRDRHFLDELSVGGRVHLYRYLLEDESAFGEHRKMKRVLDVATDGKLLSSPRRKDRLRTVKQRRAEVSWSEPPPRLKRAEEIHEGKEMFQSANAESRDQQLDFKIGQRIEVPGHFAQPVVIEEVRPLSKAGYECRVRLADGSLDETVITEEEAWAIFGTAATAANLVAPVDADQLRLLLESARIRLAYAYDKQFAVSLSGIKTLPHQIEAVYMKMLPQPRLRFLLADDPGAGKTIMAGLLVKEMKLRQAIERVLIICPAALTLQWQDELLRWFGEEFDIISSRNDQQQVLNPWSRHSQVITSLDYAKQDDVRERVWQQSWDLLIIDEAHKCSAYTKHSSQRSPQVEKTKRYELAEKLTARPDQSVLLLTATPHHGDEDRFAHFLRLVDPDLFPEPHKLPAKATEIRKNILRLGHDCPWTLRRLKEDLRDFEGRRLFPDRTTKTVEFKLNPDEFSLYKEVTAYINTYMPQAPGKQKSSVALARTVLQRRLASSTWAIHESLKRRADRQTRLLDELEALSPAQQAKRLAQLQGRLIDSEQDEDDLDEEERDSIFDQFTTALALDNLRAEVGAVKDLVARAGTVRDNASDSKLRALKDCLKDAEFQELTDGRGKLLIFTEHRDTLNYLREQLVSWGYSVCQIHGGMNVHERKRAQEDFRTSTQICVATEAAGEGINLQFCHLMINYDLPWNPTRLEQRLGRIHRIGQTRNVYCYNFVATESENGAPVIEGRILERLLAKLEDMKKALEGRVYDVIGEVLSINDVNLPAMIQEATLNPGRLEEKLDDLERIDPDKWRQYEEATGIALARDKFDVNRFRQFQEENFQAEECRLMPKYVEEQFTAAARVVGLKVETRADGLFRVEHVPQDLRSERWESVKRLGKPDTSYRKLTFHKDVLEKDQHVDAVLLGPGHPLYATVDESLNFRLANLTGQVAFYVDPVATSPYRVHFFELVIRGQSTEPHNSSAKKDELYSEIVAVKEENEVFERIPADSLYNLATLTSPPASVEPIDVQGGSDFLKSTYQLEKRSDCQKERQHFASVSREYLTKSFEARIAATQVRVMTLMGRERDEPEVALARANAQRDLEDLERQRGVRLAALDRLAIARSGPVRHVATAVVVSAAESVEAQLRQLAAEESLSARRESELAAEEFVIAHEGQFDWSCQRVGHMKFGFDIRSLSPADPSTGQRNVRRIEVKGRRRGEPIRLSINEWIKASQLGTTYWLYVVWDPTSDSPILHRIQDPAVALEHAKREIAAARMFEFSSDAIEGVAARSEETRYGPLGG
jgi:superfamily II DNA or RNA helicase